MGCSLSMSPNSGHQSVSFRRFGTRRRRRYCRSSRRRRQCHAISGSKNASRRPTRRRDKRPKQGYSRRRHQRGQKGRQRHKCRRNGRRHKTSRRLGRQRLRGRRKRMSSGSTPSSIRKSSRRQSRITSRHVAISSSHGSYPCNSRSQ